jgi:DNA-binding response OmpR family regulator
MRKIIAIIDDEMDIGYLLKSNLGSEPYDVFCFQDLKSGVQALPEIKPQFLFLDINFPDGCGLDYIGTIKSTIPECIIIVISAHDELTQMNTAKNAGANDFIPKPFTKDLILERIHKFSIQESSLN